MNIWISHYEISSEEGFFSGFLTSDSAKKTHSILAWTHGATCLTWPHVHERHKRICCEDLGLRVLGSIESTISGLLSLGVWCILPHQPPENHQLKAQFYHQSSPNWHPSNIEAASDFRPMMLAASPVRGCLGTGARCLASDPSRDSTSLAGEAQSYGDLDGDRWMA